MEAHMINILCFGDSNTYGLKPDGTGRYDLSVRYPGRLQEILGSKFHVIEEGCPGRTTIFEDRNRPYKKGLDYISPCLQSHAPLNFVVLMLGTNDCKSVFDADTSMIVKGLSVIVDRIRNSASPSPKVLIISPIHLGDDIERFDPEFDSVSIQVSKGLSCAYSRLAEETGCGFLDASSIAKASLIDREHLDEKGHSRLAAAVSAYILHIS